MANELQFDYTAGLTDLYVLMWQGGSYVIAATGAIEVYNAANYDAYDIGAAEPGAPGLYAASVPAGLAAGTYLWRAYRRSGAMPATTDEAITEIGLIQWSGNSEIDFTGIGGQQVAWLTMNAKVGR